MSASNSLSGPVECLSAHLLGGSLNKVSKEVTVRKEAEKKDAYCDELP